MTRRGAVIIAGDRKRLGRQLLMDLLLVELAKDSIAGFSLEYRFGPPRRWRFDVAFVIERVAIEFQGGIWTGGRHVRGAGYESDAWKHCTAAAAGWLVFPMTWGMLRDSLDAVVKLVRPALSARAQEYEARYGMGGSHVDGPVQQGG